MTLTLRPIDLRGQPASLLLIQSSDRYKLTTLWEKRRHPATRNADQETQQEAPDHLGSILLDAGFSFFSHF